MKRSGLIYRILLISFLFLLFSLPAVAGSGRGISISPGLYALVIGNSAYSVSSLKNPVNDSKNIAHYLPLTRNM